MHSTEPAATFDLDAIRAALPMRTVCEKEGVEFKRQGNNWIARCPFQVQKGRSFTIHADQDRAHCYSCGWSGDIYAFWGELRGLEPKTKEGFKTIIQQLASLCGIAPKIDGVKFSRKSVPKPPPETLAQSGKPWFPKMRLLRPDEKRQLAAIRGLSLRALDAAERDQRLGFALWPPHHDSRPSWIITDPERWTGQYRPLDGSCYRGKDGNDFKSYSTKNTRWPVGASQTGDRDSIVLVEGGADMLAAYQLLDELGWLSEVAIWCLFGSSNNICPEALNIAAGRRVRIIADADESQEKVLKRKGKPDFHYFTRPGWDAAAKWTFQLLTAGAAEVSTYDLTGILPEGGKDLNDLVAAGTADIDLADIFDF